MCGGQGALLIGSVGLAVISEILARVNKTDDTPVSSMGRKFGGMRHVAQIHVLDYIYST